MAEKPSSLAKIGFVPIDCDMAYVMAQYNPKDFEFENKAVFQELGQVARVPGLVYQGTDPINLKINLLFDCYEATDEKDKDVRSLILPLIKLSQPRDCKQDGEEKSDSRPPMVKVVWKDTDPFGTGQDYTCVIESVKVKYTMFLSDGTPCRAEVVVTTKQAAALPDVSEGADRESVIIRTAGLTPQYIESLNGGRAEIEKGGGKIEEPSSWPPEITIKLK